MNFKSIRLCNHDFSFVVVVVAYAITAAVIPAFEHTCVVLATREIKLGFHTNRLLGLLTVGKAQKRQSDLTRKLELAKQQQIPKPVLTGNVTSANSCVNEQQQMKGTIGDDERLEMKRTEFSRLLPQYKPPVETQDAYRSSHIPNEFKVKKSAPKMPSSKNSRRKKVGPTVVEVTPPSTPVADNIPKHVGDKAHRIHFEALIDVLSKQPLGSMGAAKLVPWVPPFIHRNIMIVVDPRKQSYELRTALQYLESRQKRKEISSNIVAITADTADEMIAWMRRAKIEMNAIPVYSDPKLEWMTMYAIDNGQWSLCVMVIDDNGIITSLHHNVNPKEIERLCV